MRERHDTIVIGAGQAGLAMSYHLRQRGREHIVLERKRVAERWHSERWESLHFQFPNWALELPGFAYGGDDPNAFAHYGEIAKFIEDYARHIDAPVRCGADVLSLRDDPASDGFLIQTSDAVMTASRVVVATGPFQRPAIPGCAGEIPPAIFQVHASRYVNSDQLPPGAVLVVGSGGSGCQIAEELYQSGRTVHLCVSPHRRVPRRYRGYDLTRWLLATGRMDVRIDSFPGRRIPPSMVITGVGGGHDIDLRRFAADGVVICGRLKGVDDGKLRLGDDAEQILARSDQACFDFTRAVDDHIRAENISAPEEAHNISIPNAVQLATISVLDPKAQHITSIVWATGYRFDFDWLKIPVLGEMACPYRSEE